MNEIRTREKALFPEFECPNCGELYEYNPSVVVKSTDLGDGKIAHVVKCPHCGDERDLTDIYGKISDIASYVELLIDINRKLSIDKEEFWAVYSQQNEVHRRKMLMENLDKIDLDRVRMARKILHHD
ncbi:MAG: hypothetical protein QMC78_06065 [Methanocellales archaeon]|nr:hypothetical protein [Methanocellales archaeon]